MATSIPFEDEPPPPLGEPFFDRPTRGKRRSEDELEPPGETPKQPRTEQFEAPPPLGEPFFDLELNASFDGLFNIEPTRELEPPGETPKQPRTEQLEAQPFTVEERYIVQVHNKQATLVDVCANAPYVVVPNVAAGFYRRSFSPEQESVYFISRNIASFDCSTPIFEALEGNVLIKPSLSKGASAQACSLAKPKKKYDVWTAEHRQKYEAHITEGNCILVRTRIFRAREDVSMEDMTRAYLHRTVANMLGDDAESQVACFNKWVAAIHDLIQTFFNVLDHAMISKLSETLGKQSSAHYAVCLPTERPGMVLFLEKDKETWWDPLNDKSRPVRFATMPHLKLSEFDPINYLVANYQPIPLVRSMEPAKLQEGDHVVVEPQNLNCVHQGFLSAFGDEYGFDKKSILTEKHTLFRQVAVVNQTKVIDRIDQNGNRRIPHKATRIALMFPQEPLLVWARIRYQRVEKLINICAAFHWQPREKIGSHLAKVLLNVGDRFDWWLDKVEPIAKLPYFHGLVSGDMRDHLTETLRTNATAQFVVLLSETKPGFVTTIFKDGHYAHWDPLGLDDYAITNPHGSAGLRPGNA